VTNEPKYKVCTLCLLLVLSSAGTEAADQEKAKRPGDLVKLVDAAAVLPPELASDTLLLVIEKGQVFEREWQIQILQDAFRYAGMAKHPMPTAAAVSAAANTDTDAGMLCASLRGGLNRLALRCRAVDHMLDIDRAQALEMFASIGVHDPRGPDCTAAVYERPDEYFASARKLMAAAFTAKDRSKGKDLQFAEEILRSVSSPSELPPAVSLIQETGGGRSELPQLTAALLAALTQMRADDRDLGGQAGDLSDHVFALAHLYLNDTASAEPIVRAWRGYLTKDLGGTRCAENAGNREGSPPRRLVQFFNDRLAPMAPTVARISEEEVRPADTGAAANVSAFWSSPTDRRLLREFKLARFGSSGEEGGPSPGVPPTAENFLGEFENWRSQQEESPAAFHEACILYRGLITDLENDAAWRGALRGFIGLLKQNALEREDPAQWYLQFSALLEISPKFRSSARRVIIRQDVAALGDGVMSQLLDRDQVLGR
jgi:hypothetical protein